MGAEVVNDLTGEVVLSDEAGNSYHLVFDLSAVMTLEKMAGRGALEILSSTPSINDCLAMILAGAGGWQRRSPGAKVVNPNLAQKILVGAGGALKVMQVLMKSLSCAEGLGLREEMGDEPGEASDARPLDSTAS